MSRSISSFISLPIINSFNGCFDSTTGLTFGIDTIVDEEGLAVKDERGDNKDWMLTLTESKTKILLKIGETLGRVHTRISTVDVLDKICEVKTVVVLTG